MTTALLPTCTLWVDGVRFADGGTPGEVDSDPVALTDLSVVWGRDNTLDQPEPGTCRFKVLDIGGGRRFTDVLHLGALIQVRADATIYPDPTVPIFGYDAGFEGMAVGAVPPSAATGGTVTVSSGGPPHTGSRSARIDATLGSDAMSVVFPPAAFGADNAWDAIPRTFGGQTWRWGLSVLMTNLVLANQTVRVMPVAFTAPNAKAGQPIYSAAVDIPVAATGWQTVLADFVPPADCWLGLRVDVRPAAGPRWDDMPAGVTWDSLGGAPVATNLVANPAPASTNYWLTNDGTKFVHTYANGEVSVERKAGGGDNYASWYNLGLPVYNPTLIAGANYQRAVEIWTDLPNASLMTSGSAGFATQAIPANQWTRVVQQVLGTGAPQGVLGGRITTNPVPAATRTNLQTDPRATSGLNKTSTCGTGGTVVNTSQTGIADHPAGITTAYRQTVTTPGTSPLGNWLVGATNMAIPPTGKWMRAGMWVKTNGGPRGMVLRLYFSGVGGSDGATVQVAANTWTWLAVTAQVPAGTVTGLLAFGLVKTGALPVAADWLQYTGLVVEQFDTNPGLATPAEYFDGDTPDDPATLTDYSWTGTANASTSQRAVALGVHVKLRRAMLVENPDGQPVPYFDGDTPDTLDTTYSWTGTANNSTSTAADARTRVTWDELGLVYVDDLVMLAPASGALQAATIFTGRITDMRAAYELQPGGTVVDVIAQTHLAELNNRYVGDTPWLKESLATRFGRIVDASGQSVQYVLDSSVSGTQVSWRDVDSRPSGDLLHQLAQSVGGALWSAANSIGSAFLWLEDLNNRPSVFQLTMDPDGVVRIHQRAGITEDAKTIVLDACDVDLEPVEWVQTTEDDATRVVVTWREQTTDTQGNPAPTSRDLTLTNDLAEQLTGRRRVAVSTELAELPAAQLLGDSLMARLTTPGWRIRGLTWDLSGADRVDANVLARVLKILDGVARMGLGILLVNIPDWAPTPVGEDIWLFLEGGTFTNRDGAWVLELLTSSGVAQGKSTVRWDDLPGGVTTTNLMRNPRAVSTGTAQWTAPNYGAGGAGSTSYVTAVTAPPGTEVSTCFRKTWTTAATSGAGAAFGISYDATTRQPVTAGRTYSVSCFMRHATALGGRPCQLLIRFFDRTAISGAVQVGADVLTTSVSVAGGTAWTRVAGTVTVPTGALAMAVYPQMASTATGAIATGSTQDITGGQIEEAPAATAYFDGSTTDVVGVTDYAWTGATDASTSTRTDLTTGWQWDDFDPAISWNDLHGVSV